MTLLNTVEVGDLWEQSTAFLCPFFGRAEENFHETFFSPNPEFSAETVLYKWKQNDFKEVIPMQ